MGEKKGGPMHCVRNGHYMCNTFPKRVPGGLTKIELHCTISLLQTTVSQIEIWTLFCCVFGKCIWEWTMVALQVFWKSECFKLRIRYFWNEKGNWDSDTEKLPWESEVVAHWWSMYLVCRRPQISSIKISK